jgi:hypothetical protein
MDHTDAVIRHLLRTVTCLQCKAPYSHEDIRVVGQQDQLWFLVASCSACGTRGLIAALVRHATEATTSEPAAPDCGFGEPRAGRAATASSPVSQADVTAMHDFLASFEGDIGALLTAR